MLPGHHLISIRSNKSSHVYLCLQAGALANTSDNKAYAKPEKLPELHALEEEHFSQSSLPLTQFKSQGTVTKLMNL